MSCVVLSLSSVLSRDSAVSWQTTCFVTASLSSHTSLLASVRHAGKYVFDARTTHQAVCRHRLCFSSAFCFNTKAMIAVVVFSYKICQGMCTLPEKHDRMNVPQKTGHDTSEAPSPAPKVLVKRVIPFKTGSEIIRAVWQGVSREAIREWAIMVHFAVFTFLFLTSCR